MTINEIKEELKKPEYNFLETNPRLGKNIILLGLGGSHAYGTNVEGSDIDIRGVMLPTIDDLIGLYNEEQRIDESTDTVIYEFNKFVSLILGSNPNTIEMLGTNNYLIFNEVGQELIDNAKLFLSKRCLYSFGGYAQAQLRRIENSLARKMTQEEILQHMKRTMDVAMMKLEDKNKLFFNKSLSVNVGDNCITMSGNFQNIPISEVRAALNDIQTIEKTYEGINHRNNKPVEKMDKHVMHLVRLYHTCFDILEKHEIITARPERDFLLEIRNGKFIKDGALTEEFKNYHEQLEEKLHELSLSTTLQEKPKFKEVNEWVKSVNSRVVKDTVLKYKEPLDTIVVR
jgi:predicted nucleotidyltransferase